MPSNNSINTDKPIEVSKGGTGVSSLTDHSVLVGSGTGAITALTVGTNGQVLVGASAADPAFATLTSTGGTVTFTAGANTLNLEAAGGGLTWSEITGATKTIVVGEAYVSNDGATLVTFTLPAAAAVGKEFAVVGKGSGLWQIAQGANQYIIIGASTSTPGAGGHIDSTADNDCVELVCTVADLGFTVRDYVGTISVT